MNTVDMLIYTLEPSSNETSDNNGIYKPGKFSELIASLSEDTNGKLFNALMMTARYVIETSQHKSYDYNKDIAKLFLPKQESFLRRYRDRDKLKLEEWARSQENDNIIKLNEWNIDNNVIKAVFLQNILRFNIDKEEIKKIYSHYKISRYLFVTKGIGVSSNDNVIIIKKYNTLLREFYIRSGNAKDNILAKYENRIKHHQIMVYGLWKNESQTTFKLSLNHNATKESIFNTIDEYCKYLKFYTERRYALSIPEENFMYSSGKGKKHYKEQFRLWERYLRIYDLYKEHENRGWKITTYRLNTIGKLIVQEFNVFTKYADTDLRKEIVKGYKEALRLIELSKTGVLY